MQNPENFLSTLPIHEYPTSHGSFEDQPEAQLFATLQTLPGMIAEQQSTQQPLHLPLTWETASKIISTFFAYANPDRRRRIHAIHYLTPQQGERWKREYTPHPIEGQNGLEGLELYTLPGEAIYAAYAIFHFPSTTASQNITHRPIGPEQLRVRYTPDQTLPDTHQAVAIAILPPPIREVYVHFYTTDGSQPDQEFHMDEEGNVITPDPLAPQAPNDVVWNSQNHRFTYRDPSQM